MRAKDYVSQRQFLTGISSFYSDRFPLPRRQGKRPAKGNARTIIFVSQSRAIRSRKRISIAWRPADQLKEVLVKDAGILVGMKRCGREGSHEQRSDRGRFIATDKTI